MFSTLYCNIARIDDTMSGKKLHFIVTISIRTHLLPPGIIFEYLCEILHGSIKAELNQDKGEIIKRVITNPGKLAVYRTVSGYGTRCKRRGTKLFGRSKYSRHVGLKHSAACGAFNRFE